MRRLPSTAMAFHESPSQQTATDVVQRFISGYALSDIANHYGLTRMTVERILRGTVRTLVALNQGRLGAAPAEPAIATDQ